MYCLYLFKFYGKSIIILLINDLTNIYRKISKIQLIYEWTIPAIWPPWGRNKLKSWIEMNVICIFDQDHQRRVVVEDPKLVNL